MRPSRTASNAFPSPAGKSLTRSACRTVESALRRAAVTLVRGDTAGFPAVKKLYGADTSTIQRAERARILNGFIDARWAAIRGDTVRAASIMQAIPDSAITDPAMRLTKAELLMSQGKDREALNTVRELYQCPCALRVLLALARGRAAEKVGEKEMAIDSYSVVADAWQNGDPEVKRFVDEAKAGLRRLGTDETKPRILKL